MTPLTHTLRFRGATRDDIARDMPGDSEVPHPVGRGAGFPVTAVDPCRSLVMSGERGGFHWTWQFGLYPIDATRTRLVSRNRANLPGTIGSTFFIRGASLRPLKAEAERRRLA